MPLCTDKINPVVSSRFESACVGEWLCFPVRVGSTICGDHLNLQMCAVLFSYGPGIEDLALQVLHGPMVEPRLQLLEAWITSFRNFL
jgi:hypothetical protein